MKILVIGQNGSGKTTLAKLISEKHNLPLLEIDTIWHAMNIPSIRKSDETTRKQINEHLTRKIDKFVEHNQDWICEGFYSFAMASAANQADQVVFLNIPLWQRQCNHLKRIFKPNKNRRFPLHQNLYFLYEMIGRTRRTYASLESFISEYEEKVVTLKSRREINEYLDKLV